MYIMMYECAEPSPSSVAYFFRSYLVAAA
eukprot:SAG31_NODE_41998_length_273_cov_1.040230_1_plen_28_part_01